MTYDQRLISIGDSKLRVLELFGKPKEIRRLSHTEVEFLYYRFWSTKLTSVIFRDGKASEIYGPGDARWVES